MVRIKKSKGPSAMIAKGTIAVQHHASQIALGLFDVDIDEKIYGLAKDPLVDCQHGKCCYCESKMAHITFGDIEHFRPKKAIKVKGVRKLKKPGYYWLAYDWENLYLSCEVCNRTYKRNQFPLTDENARAISELSDLLLELPLLINPGFENPEDFIGFRGEVPYPKNGSPRAIETIRIMGLDRMPLNEARREKLDILEALISIARIKPSLPETIKAKALLKKSLSKKAEYLNCKRQFMKAIGP